MSKESFLKSKILLTIYFFINLINICKLGYMSAFLFIVSDFFSETHVTTLEKVCINSIFWWSIVIQIALILTLILVYCKKYKPFLVVSIIDFIVYVFGFVYIELPYFSLGDFKSVIRFCAFILQTALFVFILYWMSCTKQRQRGKKNTGDC